ncbi:MAG: TolC family protein [Bacteroidota bacterium]
MRKIIHSSLVVLIGLLFCITTVQVSAQKYWTLEECVNTAIKNNITVKQRELSTRAAQNDVLQSKLSMLPSINGQITNNWNVGFAINPLTNAADPNATFRNNALGASANMILFNGFQQTNTIRQQQSNARAARFDEQSTQNTIALQVSNAFLQTLMNNELFESRKLQVEATRSQLARQQKMYELGGVNKSRLLQLKAQLANEEMQYITAENALQQSYLTLWQTMNVVPDTLNKVRKPEFDAGKIEQETQSSQQIYETFLQNSPEVKAAKERLRASHYGEYIAKGARSPRISFNAGINSFYTTQNRRGVGTPATLLVPFGLDINNQPVFRPVLQYSELETVPFSTQFEQNLGRNYGFNMSIPIFNGWQVNNAVMRSKVSRMSAELNEQQIKQDAYRNVNQAYLDFKSAWKRYEANVQNMDASKESYLQAETQYNLGALSVNEYLTTKNTWLQAETNYLQAKYELLFRRKVLDFYLGKELTQ